MNLKKGALTMILALVLGMMGTGCGSEDAVERPYDYHLDEYVTVGEYTGLEYTAFHVEVTEKEVDDAIAQVLMKYVEQKEVTAGIVKAGDYVNIKYTMEVDGQLMEGTDQQSYTVKVGDSGLLPAVDQALIGAEAGQNVTVETAFPEEYDINAEFAGKSVKYEIRIQHIVVPVYPEQTDEFASENLGTATMKEYRKLMEESMYESRLAEARYEAGEEIWRKIVESSEVLKYPDAEVEAAETLLTENFKSMCGQNGMTFEEALIELQMDEEAFRQEMRANAEAGVKEEMILYAIAREHGLEMSETEIQAYLDSMLDTNGMTADEFSEKYGVDIRQYAQDSGVLISMLYEEVFGFLVDRGVAV